MSMRRVRAEEYYSGTAIVDDPGGSHVLLPVEELSAIVEAAYREGYAAGNCLGFDADEQWAESDAKRALDGESCHT